MSGKESVSRLYHRIFGKWPKRRLNRYEIFGEIKEKLAVRTSDSGGSVPLSERRQQPSHEHKSAPTGPVQLSDEETIRIVTHLTDEHLRRHERELRMKNGKWQVLKNRTWRYLSDNSARLVQKLVLAVFARADPLAYESYRATELANGEQ